MVDGDRNYELAGNPSLTLYIASSSADPAFFAYVEDVAPDGRVTYLTEGLFRAVHRKAAPQSRLPYGQTEPAKSYLRQDGEPVHANETVRIEFPIFPIAALIRKGHSLRVSLAGADRSAFRHYGSDDEQWSVRHSPLESSALSLTARPWHRPD